MNSYFELAEIILCWYYYFYSFLNFLKFDMFLINFLTLLKFNITPLNFHLGYLVVFRNTSTLSKLYNAFLP